MVVVVAAATEDRELYEEFVAVPLVGAVGNIQRIIASPMRTAHHTAVTR